jgi:hypothetical protein
MTTIERAAQATSRTVEEITGPCRARPLAWIRFAIMASLRDQGEKVEYIGAILNRHHTTVVGGLQQANALRSRPEFKQILEAIA